MNDNQPCASEDGLNRHDPSQRLLRLVSFILLVCALAGLAWDIYLILFALPGSCRDLYADLGAKLPAATIFILHLASNQVLVLAAGLALVIFLIVKEFSFRNQAIVILSNLSMLLAVTAIHWFLTDAMYMPLITMMNSLQAK